jgi:hypothetical protein
VEHLGEEAVFNITDPLTPHFWSRNEGLAFSRDPLASSFLSSAIKRLHITLRLSLDECKEIERLTAGPHYDVSPVDSPSSPTQSRMTAWLQVCPAIAQLDVLRELQIWIDHDESTSWTLVNERAILRPLEPLLEIADLNMSISLPKLNPLWENPYRHYIQDNPLPCTASRGRRNWRTNQIVQIVTFTSVRGTPRQGIFNIERRLRHIYHGGRDPASKKGELFVLEMRDFPILGNHENDIIDFVNEMGVGPHLEKWSPAELEAIERDLWVTGGDPISHVDELNEYAHTSACDWDLREPWLHRNIPWGE